MAYNIWLENTETAPFRAVLFNVLEASRFKFPATEIYSREREPRTKVYTVNDNPRLSLPRNERKKHPVRYGSILALKAIRLRVSKDYCGNHAFACDVANPRRAGRPHRHTKFLEGADWVAFNDLVNDVCDLLGLYAHVWSDALNVDRGIVVRRGYERCVRYFARVSQGGDWCRFGEYRDCRDKRIVADYPAGTPGYPRYLPVKNSSVT